MISKFKIVTISLVLLKLCTLSVCLDWIEPVSAFVRPRFVLFFFFSLFSRVLEQCGYCSCTVHWTVAANVDFFLHEQYICALFTDSQISLFSNFFIKKGSYDTIHTFKNYFAIMFTVFSFNKISSIQTSPKWTRHLLKLNFLVRIYFVIKWRDTERIYIFYAACAQSRLNSGARNAVA